MINSAAQYFPNVSYLTKVLEGAVNVLKPGGHIFVGDIRSLPLLTTFASSVELFQATVEISIGELRDRIRRRFQHDQQLVLSPAYFLVLAPSVSRKYREYANSSSAAAARITK